MDCLKFSPAQPSDLEANRVRTDIYRSKNGHMQAEAVGKVRALAHSLISQIKVIAQSKNELIFEHFFSRVLPHKTLIFNVVVTRLW